MIKTDNHYIDEKIKLREEVISLTKNPKILECFSGEGKLYGRIKENYRLTRIEILQGKNKNPHLKGDSFKYLIGMDLTKFNIIDLDAYGIPFKYIEHIVKSGFKGFVIVTAIQTGMGKLPNDLLFKLGYTPEMIKKIPTLFNDNGLEKLKNYLYLCGVQSITGYFIERKNYFYFKL